MADEVAYQSVDEVRAALDAGAEHLKQAADGTADDQTQKHLNFCAGCLMDLRESLTKTDTPRPAARQGVNHGCKA